MNKEQCAEKLTLQFPEKKQKLQEHYIEYGELLAHIFFSEEIDLPLFSLLKSNIQTQAIRKYCEFIEDMWLHGNDAVVNVVDVTILERLSDDADVWTNFGKYITVQFKQYINTDVLIKNLMMNHVHTL